MVVSIFGVPGLPEITTGAELGRMIVEAAQVAGSPLATGDVIVVTSKIVSKAEGRTVKLDTVAPSPFARQFAEAWEKDPAIATANMTSTSFFFRIVFPCFVGCS